MVPKGSLGDSGHARIDLEVALSPYRQQGALFYLTLDPDLFLPAY